MMRKLILTVCAAFVALPLLTALADEGIGKFMKDHHKAPKGTDPTCKKVADGKASAEELATMLKGYEMMAAAKPEKGDAAAWKAKCEALVAAVKQIQAKDAAGNEAYKKAVNCKGCHNEHRE